MTQADLSAALDVDYGIILSQSDISEIERQERGLRDYELDAIATILEVSPMLLLRNELGDDFYVDE
ncbi:MAG: XRE family transcriptional regulator [Thermosynechococcaceae cyanobacterium]